MPSNINMNIDLSKIATEKCSCGNETFISVMHIRKLSPIQSPTGQKHIILSPAGFECSLCGALFSSEEIKDKPKIELV